MPEQRRPVRRQARGLKRMEAILDAAEQVIEEVGTKLGRQLDSHVMADEQRRRLWQVGLAALAAGALLWAILAGPLARSMPASWLWPEWMAARSLRMPMWEGGQRMMQTAAPALMGAAAMLIMAL